MNTFKCMILFALGACLATPAWASPNIGSVQSLNGSASLVKDTHARSPLYEGAMIQLNDTIRTDSRSSLTLLMEDGTTIDIGASSSMVIDEYVYSPDNKSENRAHFKFLKGLFKVATDQITKLNPDRFKVTTSSGTIGIRGCEVVFDLRGDVEKIFVVDIHDVESVQVFLTKFNEAFQGIKEITITESGKGVILSENNDLTTFDFSPEQLPIIHALLSGATGGGGPIGSVGGPDFNVETSDPVTERNRANRYIDEIF